VEYVLNRKQPKSHREASFLKGLEESGVDLGLTDPNEVIPELFFDAVPVWNAFRDLSNSRSIGFSIGYIPYSETSNWMHENDIISLEERQHYRKFINFIDDIWVGELSSRQQPTDKNKRVKNV